MNKVIKIFKNKVLHLQHWAKKEGKRKRRGREEKEKRRGRGREEEEETDSGYI